MCITMQLIECGINYRRSITCFGLRCTFFDRATDDIIFTSLPHDKFKHNHSLCRAHFSFSSQTDVATEESK